MGIIWELDFYSRPILDENQKKLWEVLICESPQQIDCPPESLFKYSQFCSNTSVNSLWLKEALQKAIAEAGKPPTKIRFFRRQMKNMITKACEEAGIVVTPSRRTYTLNQWLAERLDNYYPTLEGYTPEGLKTASVEYPDMNAIALPDAIRGDKGDKWAIVSLAAGDFEEMKEWDIGFAEAFPLSLFNIDPKTPIPGLIIFSSRAIPFAGWLSGLEIGFCYLEEGEFPRLRLETGVSDSWILADIKDKQTLAEARSFEKAKKSANSVHFLAIQASPTSESFAGFWLLKQ